MWQSILQYLYLFIKKHLNTMKVKKGIKMKSIKYAKFLENYPKENPRWFKGLKYKIKDELSEDYYIGKYIISKNLQYQIYLIESIKTPNNLPNQCEKG